MISYSESEFLDDSEAILEEAHEEVVEIVLLDADPVVIIPKSMFDMFVTEVSHLLR